MHGLQLVKKVTQVRVAMLVATLGGLEASCSPPRPPLNTLRRAGDRTDEGTGVLARASADLTQFFGGSGLGDESSGEPGSRELAQQLDQRSEQPAELGRTRSVADRNPWDTDESGAASYYNYRVPQLRRGDAGTTPGYQMVDGDAKKITGTIVGVVRWRGALPKPWVTACGTTHAVIQHGPGTGLAGVVVSIDAPTQVFRDMVPTVEFEQRMDRVGCVMQPQVLVTRPAGQVWIGNDGNAAAATPFTVDGGAPGALPLAPFDAALVTPTAALLTISSPGIVPGFVRVMDTPLHAMTDHKGGFVLRHVMPGTYLLHVWHPPLVELVAGQLRWGRPLEVRRQVTVRAGALVEVALTVGRAE